MVTLMGAGYAMGSASGGFLASRLVPEFGWPAQFYVASLMTLLMALALWTWLPESIRLLTVQGRTREIIDIFKQINPALSFAPDTQFVLRQEMKEASANRLRPARLFLEGRAQTTALNLALPVHEYAGTQLSQQLAAHAHDRSGVSGSGSPAGGSLPASRRHAGVISLGFLADRFGFYRVLACSFAFGGLFIGLIGWAGDSFYLLAATIFAAGFCNIGTQINTAALAATLYPTDIRSTGCELGRTGVAASARFSAS
jgi:AAHS family 4-hydroxybenzoate transporter-like MFS transporter